MMKNKKIKKSFASLFTVFLIFSQMVFAEGPSKSIDNSAILENDFVKVVFNLNKGTYSAFDKRDDSLSAKDVFFSINDLKSKDGFSFEAEKKDIEDEFGKGKSLSLLGKKEGEASIGLNIYLYDNDSMLALENFITPNKELRVMNFSPMQGQVFASEKEFKDFRVLGGDSGEYDTKVIFEKDFVNNKKQLDNRIYVNISNNKYETYNNILFTFGEKGNKQSLVFGGLSYNEFEKTAALEKTKNGFAVEIYASDPFGKLLDKDSTYKFSGDKFYFNAGENNRFKALEDYGFALKKANNVKLDTHTLTGLNFWYCMHAWYGGDHFSNNSLGTLEALKNAKSTGFLRYGPLGIRLEPDDYAKPNNQQGWWDNEHFRMYKGGQLLEPLDTIEKWGKAILAEGGVPLIYSQTGRRSLDYAQKHPEHMLFNQTNAPKKDQFKLYKVTDSVWTYDFTDEGFISHMKDVYANFAKGGLIGVKFDYPDTAWAFEGGFEDKYATTTSAYRNVYALAREGLGVNSDIHERIPRHGDITLGLSTTQRVQNDTDRFYPVFARKCGLRWYKNRVVMKYVVDVINPEHSFPYNADGSRAFYTMTYMTQARMEIGKYIELMSPEHRFELTRVTPLYSNLERSAKPIDAFNDGVEYPQIFDLKINEDWHQVIFYNTQTEKDANKAKVIFEELPKEPKFEFFAKRKEEFLLKRPAIRNNPDMRLSLLTEWPSSYPDIRETAFVAPIASTISVPLGEADEDGGLGLDKESSYYVYDFWNNNFVGKFKASDTLSQDLRTGEARMMSVHKVQANPQFISTDRHILQGFIDMIVLPSWNESKKTLSGTSAVIEKDPYKVIIALNGKTLDKVEAKGASSEIKVIDAKNGLAEMTLNAEKNTDVEWQIFFK